MSSYTAAEFEDTGTRVQGRRVYRNVRQFYYAIGREDSPLKVRVPKGFLTDGPSLPRWALQLLPSGYKARLMKPCAVHDVLREDPTYSLLESDAVFLMAMETSGFGALEAHAAFLLVRFNTSRMKHNAARLEPLQSTALAGEEEAG